MLRVGVYQLGERSERDPSFQPMAPHAREAGELPQFTSENWFVLRAGRSGAEETSGGPRAQPGHARAACGFLRRRMATASSGGPRTLVRASLGPVAAS